MQRFSTLALAPVLAASGLLIAQTPELPFDGAIDFLKLPANTHLGEAAGVATDSKGNLFVYTRTGEDGTMGGSRFFTHGGSRLFEFDPTGKFVREIGAGVYGFLFAQAVRVDAQDNVWVVDRGSSNIIKFDSTGRFLQALGRKPESVNPSPAAAGQGQGRGGRGRGGLPGQGTQGDSFNRPTGIAFDAEGNMFVSDAYTNARIVKLDKTGRFVKTWGSKRRRTRPVRDAQLRGRGCAGERICGGLREQAHPGFRQRRNVQESDRSSRRAGHDLHFARSASVSIQL